MTPTPEIGFCYQTCPTHKHWASISASEAEECGFDSYGVGETGHDPIPYLVAAAEHTQHIKITASVALAFTRNPMTMAMTGWDMQIVTNGRFVLGLGPQIKQNVTKRYSMPWSSPAARMEEFILAIRHIWNAWRAGSRVNFRGKFYRHTPVPLPFYTPDPMVWDDPLIALAAVGPRMTEVAGAVADICLGHMLATPETITSTTIPALRAGEERSGSSRRTKYSRWIPVATGSNEESYLNAIESARKDLAVHLSTPTYRNTLEAIGYGDIQEPLSEMILTRNFDAMGRLIDDRLLRTFIAVGEPAELGPEIQRFITPDCDLIGIAPVSDVSPSEFSQALSYIRHRNASSASTIQ